MQHSIHGSKLLTIYDRSKKGNTMTKIKLFRIALAANEMTICDFAALHGATGTAIHHIIRGRSKSRRLEKAIDSFIESELRKLNITYSKAA